MTRNAARDRTDLATLIAEHRALDAQVQKLDRRPYLTPAEQNEVRKLKKLKLAKKDLIADLRMRQEAS